MLGFFSSRPKPHTRNALGTLALPYDALLHIFTYLGDFVTLCRLSSLCSALHETARDDSVWELVFAAMFPALYATKHKETFSHGWKHEFLQVSRPTIPKSKLSFQNQNGFFGFVRGLFGRKPKECRVLMVGLDAAGKTTILYKLKLGEIISTIPTIGFHVESMEYKNLSFTCWDTGGSDKILRLWRHYFTNIQVLIYVVDSNDRDRISDAARDGLGSLAWFMKEEQLRDAHVLVWANKQDLPNAMSVAEVTSKLGMNKLPRGRKWFVQGSFATSGDGLYEGIDWIMAMMEK